MTIINRGLKAFYPVLTVCFALSGAAGLIYEVVWSRQLTLFVGITTYAHTAVIAAYMLGLAAGSLVIGRLSDRHPSPLRLYVWLEAAIGLYAASTPWLCMWLEELYAVWAHGVGISGGVSHILRFGLVLLLLLPPTFCMGGTLPVMVRGMTRHLPELASSSSRLYGMNTLGAMLGTLAAGYFLLPFAGLRNAVFTGVVVNFAVAGVVWLAHRRVGADVAQPLTRPIRDEDTGIASGVRDELIAPRLILLFLALSGFAALAYQIAWIRALTLVLGSSVYSFTTTLAVFLAGIGLGSVAYPRLPGGRDLDGRLKQAAGILVLAGFSAVMGLMIIAKLPEVFLWGYQKGWGSLFALFQIFTFGLSFMVMIVPTFLLGALFPLMAALWARRESTMGRDVGTVYAANTVGTIFGALTAGLVLLPHVGVHGTVLFAAGLHVLAGVGFGWLGMAARGFAPRLAVTGGLALVYGLAAVVMPAWDKAIMTSGVYNYAGAMSGNNPSDALRARTRSFEMLYYKDGLDGTISVVEDDTQRLLAINGKFDASSRHDLPTQTMLGQLPALVHPHPRSVLVIGLGSGITAGVLAANPDVEQIDIVEISREVVEASAFFVNENRHVLDDPRVNLVVADARNYLLATGRRYDLIVTQPSNPWISGNANLFTHDFFKLLQARLAPGGVVSQWFHIYNMSLGDMKSVLRSYLEVFPHVTAWLSMDVDLILLGSAEPHALDGNRLRAALAEREILAALQRVDMNGPVQIARMFLFDRPTLAAYCEGAPLNTDDRPRVEFNAPRNLYRATTEEALRSFVAHLAGHPASPPVVNLAQSDGGRIDASAIGLSIATGALAPGQWDADCAVWRSYYKTSAGHPDVLGVGCQARIQWQSEREMNHLKAFPIQTPPSPEQLASYLAADRSASLVVGGEVDLPGGLRGVWGLAGDDTSDRVKITITWAAPSPFGGYIQYAADREQPNPGREAWGASLMQFAKCFSPADAGQSITSSTRIVMPGLTGHARAWDQGGVLANAKTL